MFFPKWHLSIKGLIWGFSLSALLLEEQAQPALRPTLGLFLGEPLRAGATLSLPLHHPAGGGCRVLHPHLNRLCRPRGSGGLSEPVPSPGDTRGCISPSASRALSCG